MKTLKWTAVIVITAIVLILGWGMLIEPRFLLAETAHDAGIPNLPAEWEGRRVAFFGDLQVGMWFDNLGMIRKLVGRAVEAEPDLVLIGGDFVYKPDQAKIAEVVALLRPLVASGIPIYAVLGNHDYSMMKRESAVRFDLANQLVAALEEAGVTVLSNESVLLGRGLWLAGIGSEWAGQADPEAALADVPDNAARIIFMHNPVVFRDLRAGTAPLTLAAHTHGGQLRMPFTRSHSWLDIAREREVVADGWAADGIGAEGNELYVNRGVGFSVVPVRIRCRPELTIFTLKRIPASVS